MPPIHPRTRRRLALLLTAAVVAAMLWLLVAFALDPVDPPSAGSLGQALWALGRRPAFYPLVLLGVLGPPATWFALTVRGSHRRALLLAWAACLATLALAFPHRIAVMIDVLMDHGVG